MSQATISLVSIAVTVLLLIIFPNTPYINLYATLAGILPLYLMHRLRTNSGDPYGLYHLSLNKLDGDDQPKTEWLNMGYWKNESLFPRACEALARKLIFTSQLKQGDRVLDVGHGTGDSLVLLLSHPSIPRPSSITGITSKKSHHDRSLNRVTRLLEEQQRQAGQSTTNIHLVEGDAVYIPKRHIKNGGKHPFSPFSDTPPFDVILALDCAYHFDTRQQFLTQSFPKLSPGGRIALADICFSSVDESDWTKSKTRLFICKLFGMPWDNICTPDQYIARLKEIGFEDVELEDVTDDVFPAFVRFLKTRGLGWAFFAGILDMLVGTGARYVVVSARKREE